ncbi:MAG: agmatine deiminase family protein [Salinisphaera sp.]|jgi:agmatine/peptidylarginine deiminase|nr:agmatine deiminase family protein [Salinisphaera sp.]
MSRFLPPEWAPQSSTLLVWPRDKADWGNGLDAARSVIAAMARTLVRFQPVIMVAPDTECLASIDAAQKSGALPMNAVSIVDIAADDIWARDTGPITVIEHNARCFVDFRFDGWGGQFAASADDALTAGLHAAGALPEGCLDRREITLEGGSIEVNGAGTLLTTERCLIGGRRNDGINHAAAAAMLGDALGVTDVQWLRHGDLIGDDTDGHIDTLARFVDAHTIVYQACEDPADPHHAELSAMADELAALRQPNGCVYRLVPLPLPAPQYDPDDGHRLPAGYVNFLIANDCILMPAFDDPADSRAAEIVGRCFPERGIIPIDSRSLIRQHGGLHCAAMQIPEVVFPG